MKKRPAQSLPDEYQLIARSRQGDKEAFRHLVEGYKDRVFAVIVSIVSRREQAEDLLQEVFVKAYFALPSFQGESAFYTWIFRIASNHSLDYLRRKNPFTVSLDAPLGDADSELSKIQSLEAPGVENPDHALGSNDEAAGVLASLTADQRLILSLRELEGYSYEELADNLKCNVNTVKSRLNRAREALKAAYERKFGNILDANHVQNSGEKP